MRFFVLLLVLFLFSSVISSEPLSSYQSSTSVTALKGDLVFTNVDYQDPAKVAQWEKDLEGKRWFVDVCTNGYGKDALLDMRAEYIEWTKKKILVIHDDGVSMEPVETRWDTAYKNLVGAEDKINGAKADIIKIESAISSELAKPTKSQVNLNPQFTTEVTELDSGYIVTVHSDSEAQIKSDTGSVTIGPDSEAYVLLDKTASPKTVVGLNSGTVNLNTGGGSVVVVKHTIVVSPKTDYDVSRIGNRTVVCVNEGAVSVLNVDVNATRIYLVAGQCVELDDGVELSALSFSSSIKPLEVLSVRPKGAVFTPRPVVEVLFNVPVDSKTISGDSIVVKHDGASVDGSVSLDSSKKLVFIPNAPIDSGGYDVTVSTDIKNIYNRSLNGTVERNFSVSYDLNRRLKYSVSNPVLLNFTELTVVWNSGLNAATDVYVRRPLAKNTSNTLVELDSIEPKPAYMEKDDEGNTYAVWKLDRLSAKENKTFRIRYTILSYDINYFDFMDSGRVGEYDKTQREYAYYTRPEKDIESTNSQITSTASGIVRSENPLLKSQSIYGWMSSNIIYDNSYQQNGGALATFKAKTGVCHGYSTLYAALLRSQGVPAKYVSGWSLGENESRGLHAWVEVLVPGYGWIPTDPTWNYGSYGYFGFMDTIHVPLSATSGTGTATVYRWSGDTSVKDNTTIKFEVMPPEGLKDLTLRKLYYAITTAGASDKLYSQAKVIGSKTEYCNSTEPLLLIQDWIEGRDGNHSGVVLLDRACRESSECYLLSVRKIIDSVKSGYGKRNVSVVVRDFGQGNILTLKNVEHTISFSYGGEVIDNDQYTKLLESELTELEASRGNCEKSATIITKSHNRVRTGLEVMRFANELDSSDFIDLTYLNMTGVANITGFKFNYTAYNYTFGHMPTEQELTSYLTTILIGLGLVGFTGVIAVLIILAVLLMWLISLVHCLLRRNLNRNEKIKWIIILVLLNIIGTIIYVIKTNHKSNTGR